MKWKLEAICCRLGGGDVTSWWVSVRLVGVFFLAAPLLADPVGPGWHVLRGRRVSLEEAAAYYGAEAPTTAVADIGVDKLAQDLGVPRRAAAVATAVAPEIVALARGLRHDPLQIYNYVKNRIDTEAYYGLRKGAALTLLTKSGSDFDQADLLVALLRASGYSAQFVFGTMDMPQSKLGQWIRATSTDEIRSILGYSARPADLLSKSTGYRVARIWVKVRVGDVDYNLDPGFKAYLRSPGRNLSDVMKFNRSELVQATLSGVTRVDLPTAGGSYPVELKNLNQTALRAKLDEYSRNLIAEIRENLATQPTSYAIGGWRMESSELTKLGNDVGFPNVVNQVLESIPTNYVARFIIAFPGVTKTFDLSELEGQRLTITLGSSLRPELRLNGTVVGTGDVVTSGGLLSLQLTADHPFPGQYADQAVTWSILMNPGAVHALPISTGVVTSELQRISEARLTQAIAANTADSAESVAGELLTMMGFRYIQQSNLALSVAMAERANTALAFHDFGIVSQNPAVTISWVAKAVYVADGASSSGSEAEIRLLVGWMNSSGLEASIINQFYGRDVGLSTVHVLSKQIDRGDNLLFLTKASMPGLTARAASTWSAGEVSVFSALCDRNGWAILSSNKTLVDQQYSGHAWLAYGKDDPDPAKSITGYRIGGGLFGGKSKTGDPVPKVIGQRQIQQSPQGTIPNMHSPRSGDPVDMRTGYFTFEATDLSLGSGAWPLGLSVSRSYNSGAKDTIGMLGRGWVTPLEARVIRRARPEFVWGTRTLLDAVPALVYATVGFGVFKDMVGAPWGDTANYKEDLLGQLILLMASKWMNDAVEKPGATVVIGDQWVDFVRLPDGSFSAPSGVRSKLAEAADGTISMEEHLGRTFRFDAEGRLVRITDPSGNQATLSYSGAKVNTVQDAFGRTLNLAYTGSRLTSVTDSAGRSVAYQFDGNDNLIGFVDPEGYVWRYSYDNSQRLITLTNPEEQTTVTNTYNSLNQVEQQVLPKQPGLATYRLYFNGYRNVEEGPDGRQTAIYYDSTGRHVGTEDALGNRTTTEYDAAGNIVLTIDAAGFATRFDYDKNGYLIRTVQPDGAARGNRYDAAGHAIETIDELGKSIYRSYDAAHRLLSETNRVGATTRYSYNDRGLMETMTNANGVVTRSEYDRFGNKASVTIAADPPTRFIHDSIGRLTKLTDPVGSETVFEYDKRGLLLRETDPLGKARVFGYDRSGREISKTDRNGKVTRTTYTVLGKVQSIVMPSDAIVMSYDLHDNLVSATNTSGTITYEYDRMNQITKQTDVHNVVTTYQYDQRGNLAVKGYPGARSVTYSYDQRNRLITAQDWLGRASAMTYDLAGRVLKESLFNGAEVVHEVDYEGQILEIKHSIRSSEIGRTTYAYDAVGNRTAATRHGLITGMQASRTALYSYNAMRNRLASDGGRTFTYDGEGRLASTSDGKSYFFDDRGLLTEVTGADRAVYRYDAIGRLVFSAEGGRVVRWAQDTQDNVIGCADQSGQLISAYIYTTGLSEAIASDGEAHSYHFDVLGSTVAISAQGGKVVREVDYSPFGSITADSGKFEDRFKYVGRFGVMAMANQLYYMRARFYDPQIGRFVSPDSGGFFDGPNLYAYVGNRPLTSIDPNGLMALDPNSREDLALAVAKLAVPASLAAGGALVLLLASGPMRLLGVAMIIVGINFSPSNALSAQPNFGQNVPPGITTPIPNVSTKAAPTTPGMVGNSKRRSY